MKILGHTFEVIYTDDLNLLGGEETMGRYDIGALTIHIKASLSPSMRQEVLFHEIYEATMALVGVPFDHSAFKRFSTVLWAVLKDNGLLKEEVCVEQERE